MELLNKYKPLLMTVLPPLIGAMGGYLYFHYIGCRTGACPITSNLWFTVAYGFFFGIFLIPSKSLSALSLFFKKGKGND